MLQGKYVGNGFSFSGPDGFDCGASSGYGSPGSGTTPLSSPAPHMLLLPTHVQRALCDYGFFDEAENIASLGPTLIDMEPNKFKVCSFLINFTFHYHFFDESISDCSLLIIS